MIRLVKIAVFAVFGIISFEANAQWGINLKGGYNMNSISRSGTDINSGWHFGMTYDSEIGSSSTFIELGVLFDTRGYKVEDKLANTKVSYNSITIPVVIKPTFNVANNVVGYFAVGPYMNYVLNGDRTVEAGGKEIKEDVKFVDEEKRTQFGLSFGGGFEFKDSYILGVSYDYGLTKMMSNSADKLSALKISVGYKL